MISIIENPDDFNLNELYKFKDLITDERLKKINSYLFEKDKKRSALVYLILLFALKKEYGINGKQEFIYNPNGKPFLKKYNYLHFCFSHTKSAVAVALSEKNTGIDVEDYIKSGHELLLYAFCDDEIAFLNKSENKIRDITKLWTLKESYFKYKGTGICDNLKKYGFACKKNIFKKYGLFFRTIETENYCLSVCSENSKNTINYITFKELFECIN